MTTSTTDHTSRRLSLLKPTGHLTLGNLLGALRPMAAAQHQADCFYGIADLHALTVPHSPAELRVLVREQATLMLAVGLDASTLFVQSRVPAHSQLSYLLECVATTGELNRMIQFKEKGGRVGPRKAEEGDGTESRRLTTRGQRAGRAACSRPWGPRVHPWGAAWRGRGCRSTPIPR